MLVRLAGGEVRRHEVADEAEQAALVRRLVVDEGLAVVEVTGDGGGLEDLFLRVTRGRMRPNLPRPVSGGIPRRWRSEEPRVGVGRSTRCWPGSSRSGCAASAPGSC